MPQPKDTSVDRLVDQLVDAAKLIHNRDGLKPAQATRVSEAFSLLISGPPLGSSKGVANRKVYHEFLTRVEKNVGRKGVVLCAAALGVSRIASWRDRMRVDLPAMMREREGDFVTQKLEKIADTYSSMDSALPRTCNVSGAQVSSQPGPEYSPWPLEPVVGDTYELTLDDLSMTVVSGQIRGKILLTDAFSMNMYPTITVAISHELRDQLAAKRLRLNTVNSL